MSDEPIVLAAVPTTLEEFGAGLRQLRPASVRELEARQCTAGGVVLSKSTLQRYQDGTQLPKLENADHLDDLYHGRGWVSLAVRSLHGATWQPWKKEHGTASTHHFLSWPAWYHGLVWIALRPLPAHVETDHTLSLAWGPWRADVRTPLPPEGRILLTGKSEDTSGASVTLNLDSALPVFALHGAGLAPSAADALDIRRRWFHQDVDASEGPLRVRAFGSVRRPLQADRWSRPRSPKRLLVTACRTATLRERHNDEQ